MHPVLWRFARAVGVALGGLVERKTAMTEKLLRFIPLTELKTVRLLCRHEGCAAIVEIPVEQLGQPKYKACLACGTPFNTTNGHGEVNWLQRFQEALDELKRVDNKVGIEFVLPAGD